MTNKEIFKKVDHTLLKANATQKDIDVLCEEAIKYNVASICINPCFIEYVVKKLDGKMPVCTVIGFPLGAMTIESKIFESQDAI